MQLYIRTPVFYVSFYIFQNYSYFAVARGTRLFILIPKHTRKRKLGLYIRFELKILKYNFLVHPVPHNSFQMSREGVHPDNILAYLFPLRGDCCCLLPWNSLNFWLFVDKYIFPDTFYADVIIIVGTISVDTICVHCTVWCI